MLENLHPGYTFLVQIFNFFILLFLLNIFLYKPLLAAIHQRQEQIKNSLDEADSINAQAQGLKEEYENKISQVKKEASEIIQRTTKDAEKLRSQIIEDGRLEVRYINELAFAEIESERKKVFSELKGQISSLAVDMATKILQKYLDKSAQQALIEEFLERIKK